MSEHTVSPSALTTSASHTPGSSTVNPLWQRLEHWAQQRPDTAAIYLPATTTRLNSTAATNAYYALTYTQILNRSEQLADGLRRWGVRPSMPVAVLVPMSEHFFTVMFALVRLGALPVLIDPGIGTASLKTCLDEASPQVFVGNSKALVARRMLAWCPQARTILTDPVPPLALKALRSPATTLASIMASGAPTGLSPQRSAAPSSATVKDLAEQADSARNGTTESAEEPPTLVAYTSGSTGSPKGVQISASALLAQIAHLQRMYDLSPEVVNVATFTPFALLGPLLGMTTVAPRMDYTRPARANPQVITDAVLTFNAQVMFASPALLNTLQRWARPRRLTLPSLRAIISAGAPVSRRLQQQLLTLMPEQGRVHTPYGSTEALPVTTIDSTEMLALRHAGICLGRPIVDTAVAVVPISDSAIESLPDQPDVPVGQVGEVVVAGRQVSTSYYNRPSATTANKTRWRGQVAHRMGDLAYRDGQGRLWLCGRRAERVLTAQGTLFTTVCEEVTNAHPSVERSALVGLGKRGNQRPVMIIQPLKPRAPGNATLAEQCKKLLAANTDTAIITTVLLKDNFPVDVRHNAKIRRFELAEWAARELSRMENRPPSKVADPLPIKKTPLP